MSAPAAGSETAPPSFRKRRAGRSSWKSPNRPEARSEPGFPRSRRGMDSTSFRAASGRSRTSQHGSMRGSSMPWVESAGLDSSAYGTHSMRRTKAAQIYKKTGNLRAVQLLLGPTKLESTVRYLGIEVDDALSISEQGEL